jgi:hypothetical protein
MCALAGSTLVAFGPDYESRWTFAPVRSFAVSESGVVVLENDALVWLDRDGAVQARRVASVPLGAGLSLDATGRAYAVTRDGGLLIVASDGSAERRIALGSHPVQYLVLDPPRGRLIAASGDGWVFSVDAPWIGGVASSSQPVEKNEESDEPVKDFPSGGVRGKD